MGSSRWWRACAAGAGRCVAAIALTFSTYIAWAATHGARGRRRCSRPSRGWPAVALACVWCLRSRRFFAARRATRRRWTGIAFAKLRAGLRGVSAAHVVFRRDVAPATRAAAAGARARIVYRVPRRSCFATYLYAMTGYTALCVALLKPFLRRLVRWLSLESMLVVARRFWLRSRFHRRGELRDLRGHRARLLVLPPERLGHQHRFGAVARQRAVLTASSIGLLQPALSERDYCFADSWCFPTRCIICGAAFVGGWEGLALGPYGLVCSEIPKYAGWAMRELCSRPAAAPGHRQASRSYRVVPPSSRSAGAAGRLAPVHAPRRRAPPDSPGAEASRWFTFGDQRWRTPAARFRAGCPVLGRTQLDEP